MPMSGWEHFAHEADVGVRGYGPSLAAAFEQAALAMTAAITDVERVAASEPVGITCQAPQADLVFAGLFPDADLELLYDVSHNTCKRENHVVDGRTRSLFVHRKGATRAFGPGHADLPDAFSAVGQPVLIGGSMGTSSYILAGTGESESRAFSSACHGAGRAMSRHAARRRWRGRQLVDELAQRHILIRSPSSRGVAEEAPGAYKGVSAVVEVTEQASLARRVARVEPVICIKG